VNGDAGRDSDPSKRTPPDRLRTDLTPVVDAVVEAGAAAFVAVGDRFDDDLRYLTRFAGPDRAYATVIRPGRGASPPRAVLLAPGLFAEQAEREFVDAARQDADGEATRQDADGEPGDEDSEADRRDARNDGGDAHDFHDGVVRAVRSDRVGDPAGVRAAAAIDESDERGAGGGTAGNDDAPSLLVPASIPHDAAVYLERAGYELASTAVVDEIRAVKTPGEIGRLRAVQRAAVAGMARAETILAESVPVDADSVHGDPSDFDPVDADPTGRDGTDHGRPDRNPDGNAGRELRWNGDPLTTERLRRAVNATLAGRGVRDAGNTVIGAGTTAADLHYVGTDTIRTGETVLLDLSPRGPAGYYGDLTRTFVVEGDGGWSRRAYVAVEAAREAALAEVAPGVTAATVHGEAAAELGAYGFDPSAAEGEAGFTHGTGHGVGVSLHESPSLSSDVELRPGHVVTVEPGVYDPTIGGVRLEDLVVVTEDGYEILAAYPFGTTPSTRD